MCFSGYGFVDFATPEDAQNVLDALARGEAVSFVLHSFIFDKFVKSSC